MNFAVIKEVKSQAIKDSILNQKVGKSVVNTGNNCSVNIKVNINLLKQTETH